MLPLIQSDDKLIISKSDNLEYEDIVVFKQYQKLIAHRILHISKDHLITKGDNNYKADRKVSKNQVLGTVSQIVRNENTITLDHIYLSQSIKYSNIISSLSKNLDKSNISYLFLKGLPIHLHYNQSPPRHLYEDLDILVEIKNLKKVERIIKNMGFSAAKSTKYLSKNKQPTQKNYFKKDSPTYITIDLHTEPSFGFTKSTHINSLLPSHEKITSYLLTHTKSVSTNNERLSLLTPEAQTINLLLHFFHHNFKKVHKLSIIKQISQKSLNWRQLFSDINDLDLSPYLFPAIILFDKYHPDVVPATYMKSPKTFRSNLTAFIHNFGIFNSQKQNISGMHRFLLILFLSKSSVSKKVSIVINKNTLTNIYSVIKSFFTRSSKNSPTSPFA